MGLWRLNLLITIVFLIFPKGLTSQILRGTKIVTPQQLQRQLSLREVKLLKQSGKQPLVVRHTNFAWWRAEGQRGRGAEGKEFVETSPLLPGSPAPLPTPTQQFRVSRVLEPKLSIGGVVLPNYLENLSFGFFGAPGSGKSQSILQILDTLRQRSDWRVMVLDRNGELIEKLYRSGDIIFNPRDARSVGWSHRAEKGVSPSTIAAALIPDDPKERFFSDAAKNFIADIFERTYSNAEVWQVLTDFSLEQLKDFLSGTISRRYFEGESGNTAGSVIATAINQLRFYQTLAKSNESEFSFYKWGKEDSPHWIFLPLFEEDAETFKPLISTCFELMLRGLLSNENRRYKTALVIDELGALSQLKSLPRMLSESRKFKGSGFIGTQTTAQIEQTYGELGSRIILQGIATKLILNVRDSTTAKQFSDMIGAQERIDVTFSDSQNSDLGGSQTQSQTIRETAAVLPAEIQNLPPLEGYLCIADGSSPARVKITPKGYASQTERFIPVSDTYVKGNGEQATGNSE
ncbi:type IV secretion system protein VirD4 [Westiellopsis prolifica IICB1]|nr:type IV secretion system protein VirD4 [Westiellopsis prolifica IICB1]